MEVRRRLILRYFNVMKIPVPEYLEERVFWFCKSQKILPGKLPRNGKMGIAYYPKHKGICLISISGTIRYLAL